MRLKTSWKERKSSRCDEQLSSIFSISNFNLYQVTSAKGICLAARRILGRATTAKAEPRMKTGRSADLSNEERNLLRHLKMKPPSPCVPSFFGSYRSLQDQDGFNGEKPYRNADLQAPASAEPQGAPCQRSPARGTSRRARPRPRQLRVSRGRR